MKINTLSRLMLFHTGFTLSLLAFRVFYSGNPMYLFLIWNIFLAIIPLFASTLLLKSAKKYIQWMWFGGWLLFFPNSLYIVTDLVHLKQRNPVPLWFDAILVFSAAANGLIFSYISLQQVELFLEEKVGKKNTAVLLCGCMLLGSLGVYIGRFMRWNSWDILSDPFGLTDDLLQHFINPFHHLRTWSMTIILTLFFSIFYFTLKKIPGLINKPGIQL